MAEGPLVEHSLCIKFIYNCINEFHLKKISNDWTDNVPEIYHDTCGTIFSETINKVMEIYKPVFNFVSND